MTIESMIGWVQEHPLQVEFLAIETFLAIPVLAYAMYKGLTERNYGLQNKHLEQPDNTNHLLKHP